MTRIVRLNVDHIKRIEAVDITPDPDANLVVLQGENTAGKSSILDAIFYALAGSRDIPEQVINDQSDTGTITVDLDNGLRVIRSFVRGLNSRLLVREIDPNGAIRRSPQHLLNSLIGDLSFDPLAFDRAKPKERVETLIRALGVEEEAHDIEMERKEAYEQRTYVNRKVKEARAKLAGLMPHKDAPNEPIKVSEMYDELRAAENENEENASKRRAARVLAEEIASKRNQIERLQEELNGLLATNEQLAEEIDNLVDIDTTDIRAAIENAESLNKKAADNKEYLTLVADKNEAEKESEELTEYLATLEDKKKALIEDADFSVDNVTFDDEGVRLNGLPWEVASQAERVRTSVAIGMTLNPDLRIMLIREGALLDDTSLRVINDLAAEVDYQVWIETVREGAFPAIVIEDGRVAALPGELFREEEEDATQESA